MKGLERLRAIQELSQKNPNWVHKDLFRILHKEDLWLAAYEKIKGNKGALTAGVSTETLDGMSLDKLRKLQSSVIQESYKFTPVKQILIPKENGKTRPLGLPTSNDKIIQEVLRMVLEAVYEPIFYPHSFGFRNGIGVHSALQYVEKEFRWMDWTIKVDITNAYPTIDHKILCSILQKRISDERFLNLIRKSLKCGTFINPETLYSKLGVPQGSIVSPILANIYYDELDKWVSHKAKDVFIEKSSKRHPEYKQLEWKIKKITNQLDQTERTSKSHDALVRELKQLIQQRNQVPSLLDTGVELRYVRYADDWIIGIKGPKSLAMQLREEVSTFLDLELKQILDPIKTKVIDMRAGKFLFLGYEIFLPRNKKLTKYKKKDGTLTIRRSTPTLRFHVPVQRILKRLQERGYVTYENNKIRPISKRSYSPLEDEVIVNHFKSVWLGISNFYSGTTNWSHLQYIHYLLHMSCAMTLAHRHRTSSSKIFQNHGKRLEITEQNDGTTKVIASFPYRTMWKVSNREWQASKTFRDPFTIYANRVSKSRLNKSCCICESSTQIEMHHIKHVRKKGYRYAGFTAEMSLLNRKQVPLCRECHMAVHRGEYDGIRLSILD